MAFQCNFSDYSLLYRIKRSQGFSFLETQLSTYMTMQVVYSFNGKNLPSQRTLFRIHFNGFKISLDQCPFFCKNLMYGVFIDSNLFSLSNIKILDFPNNSDLMVFFKTPYGIKLLFGFVNAVMLPTVPHLQGC